MLNLQFTFFSTVLNINERCTLLSTSPKIYQKLLDSIDSSLTQALLFGNSSLNTSENKKLSTHQLIMFCQLRDSMDHFYE